MEDEAFDVRVLYGHSRTPQWHYHEVDLSFRLDVTDSRVEVLDADGYDFEVVRYGSHNAIERVFRDVRR